MRVLVTGGAGFIGSRLSSALVAVGDDIVCLDALHPQVHQRDGRPADLPDAATLVAGDVTDPAQLDRSFRLHGLPDVVVHLAAETGTGQSLTEASRHGRVNVVGTTELVDALSRHRHVPDRIVLASSRAVYGEGAWIAADGGESFYPGPRTKAMFAAGQWDPLTPDLQAAVPRAHCAETTWPRPTNVYAATKLAQEHVLEAWCSSFEIPLSVLRMQNVYGPGQAVGNAYTGVLTFFARQLATGARVDVYEDGGIVRDFVFVDDVVAALAAAVRSTTPGTQRVDIGYGQPVTLLEVASTMAQLAGGDAPEVSGRFRLGDVRAASADIGAASQALDWTPQTPLGAGLAALLGWVRAELDRSPRP